MAKSENSPSNYTTPAARCALYVAWHKGSAFKMYTHKDAPPFRRMIHDLIGQHLLNDKGEITRHGIAFLARDDW